MLVLAHMTSKNQILYSTLCKFQNTLLLKKEKRKEEKKRKEKNRYTLNSLINNMRF